MGRYYGMDRDKRWERNARAWNAIVEAEGPRADDPLAAIAASYEEGVTDEFIEPGRRHRRPGRGRRQRLLLELPRRPRPPAHVGLHGPDFEGWGPARRPRVNYLTMTPYDEKLEDVPAVFIPCSR